MRTIGVVTTSRADYSLYRPLLRAIQADSALRLHLIVTGMHLAPEFGGTVSRIEADGFPIGDRVEMLLSSDTPEGIAKSIGLGVIGMSQTLARARPDILVVLGDRFEMFSAALAALPFKVPVAHVHGGEVTEGAIDDALRHSITKLSHLHFVSLDDYRRRIAQMGEEASRITVCGALSIDNVAAARLPPREEFLRTHRLGDEPFLLVTYHPASLEYENAEAHTAELLAGLAQFGGPILFTAPNADTGGRAVRKKIDEFVATVPSSRLIENLGPEGYLAAMAYARAMVGNSSSGIVEAMSYKLPVVNVGSRQAGRPRGPNIVDVAADQKAILDGLRRATSDSFRAALADTPSPWGDGRAAARIVSVLRDVAIDRALLVKRFVDMR